MQVAVLGLGRFGDHLARMLQEQGHDVLAVDMDAGVVNRLADAVARAMIADITDVDALREMAVGDVDVAVVSTAELDASVLASMNCQTLEVPLVFAKARSERHALILERLGVDRIMQPERDGAERFAHMLQVSQARDFLPLTQGYGVAIFEAPRVWVGRRLEAASADETAPSRRLLAVVRGEEVQLSPVLSQEIRRGDLLVYAATDEDLGRPLGRG